MVVGIFGESCTGKSTLAQLLKTRLDAKVYTGKDYLRLSKNENIAKKLFQKELEAAFSGKHIVYVISEPEHLSLLPEDALRVLVTADLEIIKARFARRMQGNLPAAVDAMLGRKHGCFDKETHHIHVVSGETDLDVVCDRIEKWEGLHGQ